jgi:hypothetical protein
VLHDVAELMTLLLYAYKKRRDFRHHRNLLPVKDLEVQPDLNVYYACDNSQFVVLIGLQVQETQVQDLHHAPVSFVVINVLSLKERYCLI